MSFTPVADKAAGDVFTEAMWDLMLRDNLNKGVLRPIGYTSLGSATASIVFSSIAADYTALVLLVTARSTNAATYQQLRIRFNGDTGSNYDYQQTYSNSVGSGAYEQYAVGQLDGWGGMPGSSGTSGRFGSAVIVIPDYAADDIQKSCLGWGGRTPTNTVSDMYCLLQGGWWRNTNPITQITVSADAGNLDTGSRALLLGVGGPA